MRARLGLIVGEDEVISRRVQLKNFSTGQQLEISEIDLESTVHQLLD
jgi:histidyl-tRNA synthetase